MYSYCIIIKISVEELVSEFVAVNDSLIECSNTLCKIILKALVNVPFHCHSAFIPLMPSWSL